MTTEEQKKYDYAMAKLAKWESLGIKFDTASALLDKCTKQCEVCEAYKRAEEVVARLFDCETEKEILRTQNNALRAELTKDK